MAKLHIVVCAYNGPEFLQQCLRSLELQSFRHFDVLIVDDASTAEGQQELIESYCDRHGWKALLKTERRGGLHSFVEGVKVLAPDDEDVICVLDGDDWLADERALERVHQAYQDPKVWVSYGSFESFPPGEVNREFYAQVPADSVFREGKLRHFPYVFVHMQTFKAFLWKRVKDEDLRAPDGEYFQVCGDRARFYPILEMAQGHIHRIDEIIYIYNMSNPLSHFKLRPEAQRKALEAVQAKKPYLALEG